MWVEKSVHPSIESGFAFKPHMNAIFAEAFNIQSFNQDGNESAILKIKYYNPPDLIFRHLPIKEKVETIEVNQMRNGYNVDVVARVDIGEIVKIGGRVIEIYKSVTFRENFKISTLNKDTENLFASRQKYKDERNDLMQGLVKLIVNGIFWRSNTQRQ